MKNNNFLTFKERIIILGEEGKRQIDIARNVGTSRSYVCRIFKECGLKQG